MSLNPKAWNVILTTNGNGPVSPLTSYLETDRKRNNRKKFLSRLRHGVDSYIHHHFFG